jgi:hypothetical protein
VIPSQTPSRRRPFPLLVLALIALPAGLGCATLSGLSALSQVHFDLDRVSDVRIAGISVADKRSWSDLSGYDVARLGAAALAGEVPLDAVVHVRGENPASNEVDARLTQMDWEFLVEDRKTVEGRLEEDYVFPPGQPIDVPLRVRTDLAEVYEGGSAQQLFNLALALADQGGTPVEVALVAHPTIETPLGRMPFPTPVTVRKQVGGGSGAGVSD